MKYRYATPLMCLVALPGIAADDAAGSWSCRHAGLTRQVTVFYPAAPARLPCKVYYSKPDENVMPRVLWDARNQPGYCESKAAAFTDKLRSLGWQCADDTR